MKNLTIAIILTLLISSVCLAVEDTDGHITVGTGDLIISQAEKDYEISIVPDQEETEWDHPDAINIIKYDITTYKEIKDINDVEFTVIDKVERIDLHQLDYDNAQDQNEIDRMTSKIPELQNRIIERNLLIAEIKKQTIKEVVEDESK